MQAFWIDFTVMSGEKEGSDYYFEIGTFFDFSGDVVAGSLLFKIAMVVVCYVRNVEFPWDL